MSTNLEKMLSKWIDVHQVVLCVVYGSLTRQDREVVDFTWSHVKNNTEITNFGNL